MYLSVHTALSRHEPVSSRASGVPFSADHIVESFVAQVYHILSVKIPQTVILYVFTRVYSIFATTHHSYLPLPMFTCICSCAYPALFLSTNKISIYCSLSVTHPCCFINRYNSLFFDCISALNFSTIVPYITSTISLSQSFFYIFALPCLILYNFAIYICPTMPRSKVLLYFGSTMPLSQQFCHIFGLPCSYLYHFCHIFGLPCSISTIVPYYLPALTYFIRFIHTCTLSWFCVRARYALGVLNNLLRSFPLLHTLRT